MTASHYHCLEERFEDFPKAYKMQENVSIPDGAVSSKLES